MPLYSKYSISFFSFTSLHFPVSSFMHMDLLHEKKKKSYVSLANVLLNALPAMIFHTFYRWK